MTERCPCGVPIFRKDGIPYNADFSREFPDREPLEHGCELFAPVELLRSAIERSGLSARAFAKDILLRDERTVRRWLAGDSPIPQAVIEWLKAAK